MAGSGADHGGPGAGFGFARQQPARADNGRNHRALQSGLGLSRRPSHDGVMILPALPIGFGLVAVTALAAVAARRTAMPPSIFLVLVGVGLGFVPGMPRIALRPDLVLSLLLPPLLYSAGVGMSWRGFKANLQPILVLAVGCVLFTAASAAVVARYLLHLSWS